MEQNTPPNESQDVGNNNTCESFTHFVERSKTDAEKRITELTGFLQNERFDGLGFCDFGAKIAKEEGKLDILRTVDWLVEQEAKLK